MQFRHFLALLLAPLLLVLSACGGSDDAGGDAAESPAPSQGESAGPQPDLEDVPEVVAEVNGAKITKAEFTDAYTPQFQQMAMQSQASGQQVDEEKLQQQVLDRLVNTELLVQEADQRGFTASQQQVDKSLEELAKQNGMQSGDQIIKALEQQGMDREQIESQLRNQVMIDQLLADDAGNVEPTEKELRQLYRKVKEQQQKAGGKQAQKVPPFEQVRPQLAQQLESQKQAQVANALLQDLRKKAEIKVNI